MIEQEQNHEQEDIDLISWLLAEQLLFEAERIGTDGSLAEFNTLEYGLTRGVIGEAQEALEAVENGDIENLKVELADTLIFLASVMNHAGMTAEEIKEIATQKMLRNHSKYKKENFEGRTVKEAMIFSREQYEQEKLLRQLDDKKVI